MPYVYRAGAKDVHRGWRAKGTPRDWDDDPCQFDVGGKWSPGKPPDGSRCAVCFGDDLTAVGDRSPDRNHRRLLSLASGMALGAALVMLAANIGPAQVVPVVAVSSSQPSSGTSFALASALLPAPSPTPQPIVTAVPSAVSTPEPAAPLQVVIRVIERTVERVASPTSAPAPSKCPHPGLHNGFECKGNGR